MKKYIAEIRLSPSYKKTEKIEVSIDKDIEHLTYDEVTDAVYAIMEKQFPEDSFPKAEIYRLWIVENDGRYPVISESDKKSIEALEKNKKYKKFLMLPDALYSLTDECRLYMTLVENGIISDKSPFEFETYHRMVEDMNRGKELAEDSVKQSSKH